MKDRAAWALWIAVLLAVGVGLWNAEVLQRSRVPPAGRGELGTSPQPVDSPSTREESPGEIGRPAPQPREPQWLAEAPDRKRLREETRSNPHRTPPSLGRFAEALSHRSDVKQREGSRGAREFLSELRQCAVSGKERPPVVQALCVDHATRLIERYPELQGEAERLRADSPPEARRLAEALKRLTQQPPVGG